MKESTVSSRLREYLTFKSWTAKDFERITGLGNGTAARIGEATRKTTFVRISNSDVDLNIKWLLTGEGEMLKPKEQKTDGNAEMVGRAFRASTPDEGVANVRFFAVTPTATFQEFCDGESEDPEYIPVIAPANEYIDESSCVFEIHGESMLPMIPDKARVLCREIPPTKWHNISEGVIVIAYRDRFVIKRVIKNRLGNDDYLVIASDNPDYPGEETVSRADIRCISQARQVLSYPIR